MTKVVDNSQIHHLNAELTRLKSIISQRDSQIAMMNIELSRPREKEIMVETQTVVDHGEVERLTHLLHQRDQQIIALEHRPLEKEIVVETQTVMDHGEVQRLTGILHQRD